MEVAITLGTVCAGGGHAEINVSVDGDTVRRLDYEVSEVLVPITLEPRRELVTLLLRARLGGMTPAQARSAMQAGITVTL